MEKKYLEKIVTAKQAMQYIKNGDRIVPGDFCAEPVHLMDEFAKRAKELNGVKIVTGGNIGPEPHLEPGMEKYIQFNCLCAVPKSRKAILEGRCDYTPAFFHEWPRLFQKDGPLPVDVALVQLSVPDENGDCTFGISVDYTSYLPKVANITIAQINKNMPKINGPTINLSEIDFIVEYDEPIVELPKAPATDIDMAIGKLIEPLIPDGATLQIGRGKLPDAIMELLKHKNDLGVHSEMVADGVMELMKLGVVNNSAKKIHKGKTIATFLSGTKEFYDWADGNQDIELFPVDYVNDPFVVAQNPNMISINSAIEIDLTGQVVAEMVGPMQFTGIGGHTDHVRGARRSKGGKTIIAFPSTTSNGKISKIVPTITPGAAVGDTRFDVDYIVTEYGVAQLWGKNNRERVEQIINIAHPKFRDELLEKAKEYKRIW